MNTKTINPLDKHLDAILRAGGSALKYYDDIGQNKNNMRAALLAAVAELAPVSAAPAGIPAGWQLVPVEPTHEITAAMLESEAQDDEGKFPSLCDLLDFSGANKALTVVTATYRAGLAAAPAPPKSI